MKRSFDTTDTYNKSGVIFAAQLCYLEMHKGDPLGQEQWTKKVI